MIPDLIYLAEEICCGVEIYFTSWKGGQYRRTAFILCDDYMELSAKLYLRRKSNTWTDVKTTGGFKPFPAVLREVPAAVPAAQRSEVSAIVERAVQRRNRRNEFFHSTSLLDLSITSRGCVEAFNDLLELNELFYGAEWIDAVRSARSLTLMGLLLKVEAATFSDPSLHSRVDQLLAQLPRNAARPRRRGAHVAEHPDDLHLRLCLSWSNAELQEQIVLLLASVNKS